MRVYAGKIRDKVMAPTGLKARCYNDACAVIAASPINNVGMLVEFAASELRVCFPDNGQNAAAVRVTIWLVSISAFLAF